MNLIDLAIVCVRAFVLFEDLFFQLALSSAGNAGASPSWYACSLSFLAVLDAWIGEAKATLPEPSGGGPPACRAGAEGKEVTYTGR